MEVQERLGGSRRIQERLGGSRSTTHSWSKEVQGRQTQSKTGSEGSRGAGEGGPGDVQTFIFKT